MGMTDNFTPNEGNFEGVKKLTVLSVEFVTAATGTTGLKMEFYKDSPEHPMYKTLYQSKMFDRFLTGYVLALGLDPMELAKECNQGNGDYWILKNFPGKTGEFDCRYGEPNKNGKRYLAPNVKAEIEFAEWKAAQDKKNGLTNKTPAQEYEEQKYSPAPDGEFPPDSMPF